MRAPLIIQIAASAVLTVSCGASLAQLRDREMCYTRAETQAQKRIDVECEGMAFAECPAARAILQDLQKAQEACP
jgi:hypothetical protein